MPDTGQSTNVSRISRFVIPRAPNVKEREQPTLCGGNVGLRQNAERHHFGMGWIPAFAGMTSGGLDSRLRGNDEWLRE
jgi:hypothetical protein